MLSEDAAQVQAEDHPQPADRIRAQVPVRSRARTQVQASAQARASAQAQAQAQARAAAGIPSVDIWPDLTAAEREYRAQVLDDIARRVVAEGVRHAAPSPDRGRQFLPFAALKE